MVIIGNNLLITVILGKITKIIKTLDRVAVTEMIGIGRNIAAIRQLTKQFLISLAVIAHSMGELHHTFDIAIGQIDPAINRFPFFPTGKGNFFRDHCPTS